MPADKKRIREDFRNAVFARDGNKCRVCGRTDCTLDAHHITDRREMPNGGYVPENGISLCPECHVKAEVWHSSAHEKFEPGFSPEDLYTLIGSTGECARAASEKL
jgi:5-methylcytosine-specific restriction endonuclease McrA